jgi:hypothetical protein
MIESKRRPFSYKVARFNKELGDPSLTLEKLLRKALKAQPKALDRAENPDGAEFRFLNYHALHSITGTEPVYGCEFLAYEKGSDQSTIKLDPTAEEIDVDSVKPGSGSEFLSGAVYFGVVDNHVVLVGSRALRSLDLEKYLNWFLTRKSKVLPEDNYVALADHVPNKKKTPYKGVKGIEITRSLEMEPTTAAKPDSEEEKSKLIPLRAKGEAWNALKEFLGLGYDLPAELNVNDLTKVPDIEVKLFLRWKSKKGEDDQDFLNSIARNMSHVEDEFDYKVHTKTGTIKKGDFKIFEPVTFKWNKGRPQFDDLFPKMATWLASLIESGKIKP